MKKTALISVAVAMLTGNLLRAQLVEGFIAPPSSCCLAGRATTLADQL